MDMGLSGQEMMKQVRANRLLQRRRRKQLKAKFNDLHQMNNVRSPKVFNTELLDKTRQKY